MPESKPDSQRLSADEIGRRGRELLARLPAETFAGRDGEIVAIDVLTGEFAVGSEIIPAHDALRRKVAAPVCYFSRIGSPVVANIGRVPRRAS